MAASTAPSVRSLPSRKRLSQFMMPGVVKPITPTFTGTVTLLPSGAVAVNCLVTMV
ncbi:hypothetical protein D3C72_1242850 [compost metagenome]